MQRIADRERAPMYIIGETTGDMKFTFENAKTQEKPIDLELKDMFGNPPKTIMEDKTVKEKYSDLEYTADKLEEYLEQVLQLEAVASKDWLTNKVDRSVSGRVVRQQGVGPLHLPLSDVAVVLWLQRTPGYCYFNWTCSGGSLGGCACRIAFSHC